MARCWYLMHGDGSEWTRDELTEIVRDERRHDGLWPYDASIFAVAIDDDLRVYLLDTCKTWHMVGETDNMVVRVEDKGVSR